MGDIEFVIEIFGEGFEVDIGGIYYGEEFVVWFWVDIVGGYGDIVDVLFVVGECGVDGVFGEDYWVVVGIGYGIGIVVMGCCGNGLWIGLVY